MVQKSPDSSDTALHCLCKPQIQVLFWIYTARSFVEGQPKENLNVSLVWRAEKGLISSLVPDQTAESPTKGATGLISLISYHRDKHEINSPTPQLE